MNLEILYRYIAGNATSKEKEEVIRWLDADKKNMKEFLALRKLYDISIWQQEPIPVAKKKKSKLMLWRNEDIRCRFLKGRFYFSIACVAALFGGIIWYSSLSYNKNKIEADWISAIAELDHHSTDTTEQILLVTQERNRIEIEKGDIVTYSCKGEISVNEKKIKNLSAIQKDIVYTKKIKYNQLIVPRGKFSRLVLSDGSSLYVNAGTKVVYPNLFEEKRREIYVDGEVFIDVKQDKEHPFIVKTSTFDIEVLGTAFNVNAYKKMDEAEVVLLRGAVTVTGQYQEKMDLLPGELLDISKGIIADKRIVNTDDYVAWTKGRLPLAGRSWKNILNRLSLFYGVSIDYDADLEYYPLHGTIDLSVPLDKVLERISKTLPIICEKRDKGLYIYIKQDVEL